MQIDPKYRITAGLIGGIGAVALAAQVWLMLGPRGLGQVLWQLAAAFTILTNTLMSATMLRIAATGRRLSFGWMSMLTMAMIMVGAVYHALLADLQVLTGLRWWTDQTFHTLMPAAMAWFWLTEVTRVETPTHKRKGRPYLWLLWPVGFVVYALVRGKLTGRYVYPFLNLDVLGWSGVGLYLAGIGLAFGALAYGMAALARVMPLR
jgi:hypothetical protein